MPVRQARQRSSTPPATPPKTRSKRNGSGSSQGSLSSQGSQKYTAYLRERPSPSNSIYATPPPSQEENPFSREEEIYGRLQLESSQPTLVDNLNDNDNNNNDDDLNNVINNTNQIVPNLPTDRGVVVGTLPQRNNSRGLFKNISDFFIGLFAKLLNLIGFIISFIYFIIKNSINFVWINLSRNTTTTTRNPSVNIIINNNNRNRWPFYLLFFAIIFLLLLLSLNVKFGQVNSTFMDYFSSNSIYVWAINNDTYKIQPIKEKISDMNDNKIITADDFRQMIITEVRNIMKSEDIKSLPSLPNEPLRMMIRNEVKHMISSEVKKGLTNARVPSTRSRGTSRGEEMLEIIRKEASHVVKDELLKYSQDKLNRPDFALYSGGAKIISKYTSKTYELWPEKWYQQAFAYFSGQGILRGKPPVTAISHDTNVGQCWPFPGQEGQLAVFLNRKVYVTAVTYDHVSKDIAVDVLSAPKDFEVWGVIDDGGIVSKMNRDDDDDLDIDYNTRMESTEESCGKRIDGKYEPNPLRISENSDDDGFLSHLNPHFENETSGELRLGNLGSSPLHLYLGKFTYNIDGLPVQTFEIPKHIIRYNKPVRAIIMKVNSNWGKPEYTCLYRFRVHGEPADKADN